VTARFPDNVCAAGNVGTVDSAQEEGDASPTQLAFVRYQHRRTVRPPCGLDTDYRSDRWSLLTLGSGACDGNNPPWPFLGRIDENPEDPIALGLLENLLVPMYIQLRRQRLQIFGNAGQLVGGDPRVVTPPLRYVPAEMS